MQHKSVHYTLHSSPIENNGLHDALRPNPHHATKALLKKAAALEDMGHNNEALATYNHLIKTYSQQTTYPVLEQVAAALFHKGILQNMLKQPDQAITTLSQLIQRFEPENEPMLQIQTAKAMLNKGVIEDELGRYEAAEKTLKHLIRRYQDTPQTAIQNAITLVKTTLKGYPQQPS